MEKRVKFKRFVLFKGYTWKNGGEGKVIAETNTFYKVKTNWYSSEWVNKMVCEEITTFNK